MDDAIRTRPEPPCDIVMKGGVTSGVVYPRAVYRLAKAYRLKNVGGTSAGAIAASAAAAAEFGRDGGAFERLDELPQWIGTSDNLRCLFQPARSTRGLFGILLSAVAHKRRRPVWLALASIRHFPLVAVGGAIPGFALGALALLEAHDRLVLWLPMLVAALVLAVGGAAVAILVRIAWDALRSIPRNDFGICTGMPGVAAKGQAALTPWLEELIDGLAGREVTPQTAPLTFAELWAGPGGDPTTADPNAEPWMRLEMMTTNLTNRRAERLPWASRDYFFDPGELRRLFPERIVRWLEAHPPPLPAEPPARCDEQMLRGLLWPLRPLPHAADLPVVVATRMSLSFPLLLSAIPLRRVDWTLQSNDRAREEWRAWIAAHADEWSQVADEPERIAALATDRPKPQAERCWFSDGGIASNFPVHFFDAVVPRHPTFAINLRPFRPGDCVSRQQCDNVWMVDEQEREIFDWWYRFDRDIVGFLGGIVRTMQNRVDEAQMRLPGYRDRVVHVSLTDSEGGMNLTMDPTVVADLTERGRCAGERLVERFARPQRDPNSLSWDDHRWVRYRSSLAALAAMVRQFATGYTDERMPTYAALLHRGAGEPPDSDRVTNEQRELAQEVSDGIVALARRLDESGVSLAEPGPSPLPAAKITPQDPPVRRKGA